ncbi:MAG: stage V sporulation protein AA [Eubacteriales bacterium]|nr:stage V sporulation protein AA [Eubacteriales bacterium]
MSHTKKNKEKGTEYMNDIQTKSINTDPSVSVYIALEQSVMVQARKVHIEDIATIFCPNPDLSHKIKKSEVLHFQNTEQDQAVVTAMHLIGLIHDQCKQASVKIIGSPETIVYYRNLTDSHKRNGKLKAVLLMILAFFGTAYSIMSYNEDVSATDLLTNLHTLFTGVSADSSSFGVLAGAITYSIGLCIGMVIFFNHGINTKKLDDPTPLQVQMRLYEEDVNKAIILNSSRKGNTIDIS